jgi:septum formation topological specificity factor MinE
MKKQRFNEDQQTKKLDELLDELTDEILEVIYSYLGIDKINRNKLHLLSITRALCDVLRQAISHIDHRELRAGLFTDLLQVIQDIITKYPLEFTFLNNSLSSLQCFNAQDLVKLRPHLPILITARDHYSYVHDQAPENERKPKKAKLQTETD